MIRLRFCILTFLILLAPVCTIAHDLIVTTDPLARYCHVQYHVPSEAPNEVTVTCSWSPSATNQWRTAGIRPFISETAMRLTPAEQWQQWTTRGRIIERNAPGLTRPGLYLWRIRHLYTAGVEGIYIYQSDQCVLGRLMDRRCARLLASSEDVRRWWEEDARFRPQRSKGIYITRPSRPSRGWRPRERVRIWLEGIKMGEVEMILDGKLVNHYNEPPYLLGTEERTSDDIISANHEVELLVRAQDGDHWFEQRFTLQGERKPR